MMPFSVAEQPWEISHIYYDGSPLKRDTYFKAHHAEMHTTLQRALQTVIPASLFPWSHFLYMRGISPDTVQET